MPDKNIAGTVFLRTLKRAFLSQHLDYFLPTLDAAEKGRGLSPQEVLVWQRAVELLEEAREKLLTELVNLPPAEQPHDP